VTALPRLTLPLALILLGGIALAAPAPVEAQDRPRRPPPRPGPPEAVRVSPEALRAAAAEAVPILRLTGPDQIEILALPEGADVQDGTDGHAAVALPAVDAAGRARLFRQHPDWPPPPPERDFDLAAEDPALDFVRLTPRSLWHPRASLYLVAPVVLDAEKELARVLVANYPDYARPIFLRLEADLVGGARYLIDFHVTPEDRIELGFQGLLYELEQSPSVKHVMGIVEPTSSGRFELTLAPPLNEGSDRSFVLHAVEITRVE